jgi:hypothetical protein
MTVRAPSAAAGHARGVRYVKLPAQDGDGQAVALAGTQVHAEHRRAFLQQQQGGSGPGG